MDETWMRLSDSLKKRIVNVTNAKKLDVQRNILRYLMERFLYRLSKSKYIDNFVVRGSLLMYIMEPFKSRHTKDIDYMGLHISNDFQNIENIIKDICKIQCPEDCVVFDIDSITLEKINLKHKYTGVRVNLKVYFGKIREVLKFDIGFDDIITPEKKLYNYPVILKEMPPFKLYAYTIETSIAEKLSAMIALGDENTRMKDFYDVWFIFNNIEIDFDILDKAITNTFRRKKVERDRNSVVFDISFYLDEKHIKLWTKFVTINNIDDISFYEIGLFIVDKIKKIL